MHSRSASGLSRPWRLSSRSSPSCSRFGPTAVADKELANRLLRELEDNAESRAELLIDRDALIVRAWGAGAPVTHIAEAADLDRTQVHRIVKNPWIVARDSDALILSVWKSEAEAIEEVANLGPGHYHRQVGTDEKGNMTPFPDEN